MRSNVFGGGLFLVLLVSSTTAIAEQPTDSGWPRQRLVKLLRDLSDEAFDLFVVQDPDRRVYGMAYEFVRDGNQVQDFGLDSMHDGAWLMSALITAHRADPDGGYLERAQKYQVPFYVNVLTNSDVLFPHMVPREDQEAFDGPIKGWAPRGWDDGPGVDLVAGVPFSTGVVSHENGTVIERDPEGRFLHAYFTSSHHLLQDLADSLLNVWLTTRDPAVSEAILLIHQGREKYGHRVPVVQKAAGMANNLPDLHARGQQPAFSPEQALRPLWQALIERKPISQSHYSDGLAWAYGEEAARAGLSGEPIPPGFVANTIGQVYCQRLAVETFFTPDTYRDGYTLAPGVVRFEDGRLVKHHEPATMMFSRGIQYAWIAAALLPELRGSPDRWNTEMQHLAGEGTLDRLREAAAQLGAEFNSDAERITGEMDRYTLGTIDYWAHVREELGYLPRGYFVDGRKATWVRMAELGAYAHLMKLIAYRLMDQQGVSEWQLIWQQQPAQPRRHQPLPASVRRIQGLNDD